MNYLPCKLSMACIAWITVRTLPAMHQLHHMLGKLSSVHALSANIYCIFFHALHVLHGLHAFHASHMSYSFNQIFSFSLGIHSDSYKGISVNTLSIFFLDLKASVFYLGCGLLIILWACIYCRQVYFTLICTVFIGSVDKDILCVVCIALDL